MRKVASILILITLIISTSCINHDEIGSTPIDRFELEVTDYPELDSIQQAQFITRYAAVLTILNQSIKSDSIALLPLEIPTSPIYTSFIADVTNQFSNTRELSSSLYATLKRYATITTTAAEPKIITYITPYNQSIMVADSALLIGLNHYLGENHPAYSRLSAEVRISKTAERIPYDITEALLRTNYPNPNINRSAATLLEHILYEGFIIYAQQQLIPDFRLATALGYTPEQIEWSSENSQQVWKKLITAELLYTTNPFDIEKLIKPTPHTTPISPDSPGRLGVWIGTQIITSYVNAANISDITELYSRLKTTDSQTILMQSHYYGK